MPDAPPPDLSVIVPLKCARTPDPLEGVRAWARGQTCKRSRLEVVVAANGDHPEWERRLADVLTEDDRLLRPPRRLGTLGLLDAGVRAARGRWVYLCELHTVADPTCAEEMLAFLERQEAAGGGAGSLAGAVASSGSRGEGAIARMEARYYRDVVGSRLGRPDAPVPLRGVALRRDVLLACGGIPGGYSIFADQAVAASLHERGHRLGHAGRARFVHVEQSSLAGHRADVALFTWGEMRYRAAHDAAFCERHLGRPEEWAEREGLRPAIAALRLGALARALRGRGRWRARAGLLGEAARQLGRRGAGAWPELLAARLATARAELRFLLARDEDRRYRAWVDVKRHYTRCVRLWWARDRLRRTALAPPPPRETHGVAQLGDDELVGFHALETHEGRPFRWTGPSAVVRLQLPPGRYDAALCTGRLRADLAGLPLALAWNGQAVDPAELRVEEGEIRFSLRPEAFVPGPEQRLALACPPLRPPRGSAERRRLGLPVFGLRFERRR